MVHKNSFKTLLASLIAALLVFSVAGCSSHAQAEAGAENTGEKDKPLVYATFFPVADLTSRIVGDKMEVKTVIKGSQEPHDFELQTSDRAELSKADLIVTTVPEWKALLEISARAWGVKKNSSIYREG